MESKLLSKSCFDPTTFTFETLLGDFAATLACMYLYNMYGTQFLPVKEPGSSKWARASDLGDADDNFTLGQYFTFRMHLVSKAMCMDGLAKFYVS